MGVSTTLTGGKNHSFRIFGVTVIFKIRKGSLKKMGVGKATGKKMEGVGKVSKKIRKNTQKPL